ncbi:methyltransferase family protein [Desulfatitalea alkaliphila]|uniref:O-methyltransferase dimerisation domain-containing protein n=1 Tax=Desulfatitalea alkaliphila TaxID=2929485 RepID=A0AA41R0A6_9BACT|nr:methyltransferase dimerization domain-containing protein [Desulfatitalea alkaliphila]MCJ8499747.1 hypothetical protein [Desulfatitalea alkaliphila]
MKRPPDAEMSYRPLHDIAMGPLKAALLNCGIDLKVFDLLTADAAPDEVAGRLGTHAENTRRLLDALTTSDLLEKRAGLHQRFFRPNPLSGTLSSFVCLPGPFTVDVITSKRYSVIITILGGDIMATQAKRSTVYFDPIIHKALKLKSIETSKSISDLVNDAVKAALAEDAEDLTAFEERANEPLISFSEMLKRLKKDARI